MFVTAVTGLPAGLTANFNGAGHLVDITGAQRLVLQRRIEVSAAFAAVPEWGVGRGPNDVQMGLRQRYEIRCGFAPYVGV